MQANRKEESWGTFEEDIDPIDSPFHMDCLIVLIAATLDDSNIYVPPLSGKVPIERGESFLSSQIHFTISVTRLAALLISASLLTPMQISLSSG